jgi:hypothetical protein
METHPHKILGLILEHMSYLKLETDLEYREAKKDSDQDIDELNKSIQEIEELELSYFKKKSIQRRDDSTQTEDLSKFNTYPLSQPLGTIYESREEGDSGLPTSDPTRKGQRRPLSVPIVLHPPPTIGTPSSQDTVVNALERREKAHSWDHRHTESKASIPKNHQEHKKISFVKENRIISVSYESDSDSESDAATWGP